MSEDLFAKNYFEIFDLAVTFDVDQSMIAETNRNLQKQYHPDRFANANEQDARVAMQKTSLVNQAFQTLKAPISRAQYMLKLKGVDMESETDTSMDAAFLMEQMEFREAIADVREKDDPLDELDRMATELKSKLTSLEQEFTDSYDSGDLGSARNAVRKMQFIIKAQTEVKEISEQLEDELF
jgi:molecular chaperone HscB